MSRLGIMMVPVIAAALSAIVIFLWGAAMAGGWVAGFIRKKYILPLGLQKPRTPWMRSAS